jgi:hypothetical protein
MAFDVFISHSSKDKQAADATCAALEAAAIRCWIAPRDVRAGREYAGEIIDAIDSCRVMVLIFSSSANASNQVRREIERAVSKSVTIVPMRIENVLPSKSMEFYLDSIHWLDALTPPLTNHLQHLVEQVTANLRVDPASSAELVRKQPTKLTNRNPPSPRSRLWPFVGALVLLVLLVAGAITMVSYPQLNIFSKPNAPATPTQQLLLNVLRASFNEPLEFTWNAPYAAMQKPISLGKLNHANLDGYGRELLFWLFTDSLELQTLDHLYRYHYAPPDDYGCAPSDPVHRCFVDWIRTAALTGLTAQEETSQTTDADERLCFNEALGQEAYTTAKAAVSGEGSKVDMVQIDLNLQLLYHHTTASCGDISGNGSGYWNDMHDSLELDMAPPEEGIPYNLTIFPRSAFGVFEFLGTVMKMRREHVVPSPSAFVPPNRSFVTLPPVLLTAPDDPNLLTVVPKGAGSCFVEVQFKNGDYCVPVEAATTKSVLSFLRQLTAAPISAGQ